VVRTHGSGARIGAGASVGPFTYLRPGTVLGEEGKIGAFYETKNVTIGRGSKLSHLGYAGDAEIGEYTNIGCGNITANYDGVNKHRTVIGSHVRTSSNTVFVAPVTVGDGAYTGAGAVVRKDVPAGALALSIAPAAQRRGLGCQQAPGQCGRRSRCQSERDNGGDNHGREHHGMSEITAHGEKKLVLASGGHTRNSRGDCQLARHRAPAGFRLRLRQRRDLRPIRRERPRHGRLRHPGPSCSP
jgi:serine acetyltransferase